MWLDRGQELGTGSQGPAFPAWLLEGPAEHPPNLGKLAPLQEMGKGRAVSWRAKATELLGDHGMQRQDTYDFLQLLMAQPRVLEPNLVPWGWWQPPAQPVGGGRAAGRGAGTSSAPTSLGAQACEVGAAAAPLGSSAFVPLALPSTVGHRGLSPSLDPVWGEPPHLPGL